MYYTTQGKTASIKSRCGFLFCIYASMKLSYFSKFELQNRFPMQYLYIILRFTHVKRDNSVKK
jgi:hypothetical protein